MGHRGTGVPRGTVAHLDKRRPVSCPATAKVASGIAVTARGQRVTGPEWASGLEGRRISVRGGGMGTEVPLP